MAWRRKRKADEKGPPKKGRAKEKDPPEGGTQQTTEAGATVPDEPDEAVPPTEGGAFFGCYLLSSISPKRKGATYIGFTVNPARRLRQHNGQLTSGAWKTKSMRPVEMVLVVYGFRTMVHALQFEWAWQHPTVSLAVKEVAAGIKNRGGVKGKIAVLYAMLNLPKWNKLPLVLQFVSGRHIKHKLGLPPLPGHMDCILAPLSRLRCQVDDAAEDAPIRDEPTAAEAPALAEESGGLDAPGDSISEGQSGDPPADTLAREPASDGSADGPSESTWADPLSDWDWLARDREAELEKEGSQEMEPTDPFATWQRLKVPKRVEKGLCEGDRTAGPDNSRDTKAGPSKEAAPLAKSGMPRVGRDWGSGCLELPDDAERSECRASTSEQGFRWGVAGETNVASRANAGLCALDPPEKRVSGETVMRSKVVRNTTGTAGEKETINLVEEDDPDAHTPSIPEKTSSLEQGSRENQLRRDARKATPSLGGVELVVLEDSPLQPKAGRSTGFASSSRYTSRQADCPPQERPRTTPMVAPDLHCTRAGSDARKERRSQLLASTTIIDLDP